MPGKKNLPFFIFAVAVFAALLMPSLVQDGMFMDGLIYAAVAKNFASGTGTWWNLHLNNSMMNSYQYHDQPPLTFWISSYFFRIFGNSIYTERIYSFSTACVSGWLVMWLWKIIYKDERETMKISWLPFLFWIIPPVCFWSYANNMEENTMSIFILLSAGLILIGMQQKNTLLLLTAAGICIFLSSLCKGIQGTFPIVMAGIYWVVYRNFSFGRMMIYTLILMAVPGVIYFFLFQNNVILDFFKDYYNARLYTTFTVPGAATTASRFYLLQRLAAELLLPLTIVVLVLVIFRKRIVIEKQTAKQFKISLFFFLTGLSGTLPLMVTLEQRRFYLVPALPFFAIAMASLIAPVAVMLIKQVNLKGKFYKSILTLSFVLLTVISIFSISKIGSTRRDKEMLHDVYAIGTIIPEGTEIMIDPSLSDNWSLQLYFARHYNITLDRNSNHQHLYLIVPGNTQPDNQKFAEVNLDLKKYKLYKLTN